MKVTLILPRTADRREVWKRKRSVPTLSLPLLAAFTPADVDVRIIDDSFEETPYGDQTTLVGITAMTETITRAYEIADEYRRRGTTVVLGGIHPSLLPEEAACHADSVVIGDADETWPQLLEDFSNGCLKKTYRMERLPSLASLPRLRRDLLNSDFYYPMDFVYATRGCPGQCSFCSIPSFYGSRFRHRPVSDVVAEIASLPNRVFGFTDECLDADVKYLKNLLSQLVPLNKKWIGEVTVNFCRDDELLRVARRSGCVGVFIGFETISEDSLRCIKKGQNVGKDYRDLINRAHDQGIGVEGSFIFGFDGDDKAIFERTLDFFLKSRLDSINTNILKPYPGTRMFEQLHREDRLLSLDWADWAPSDRVLYRPRLMSPDDLLAGMAWVNNEVYSLANVSARIFRSFGFRSLSATQAVYYQNMGYRRRKVTCWNHRAYNPSSLQGRTDKAEDPA